MSNGCIVDLGGGCSVAVDYWSRPKTVQACFLTHAHTDHTKGLSDKWDHHKIHCTEETADFILAKWPALESRIVLVHVDDTIVFELVDAKGGRVNVSVTVIDARHCPGSVMFLFEGRFGRILHTGDFRWEREDGVAKLPSILTSSPIDALYVDNTYCNPMYEFPSRKVVLKQIVDIILNNPDYDVMIGMDNISKEEIISAIWNDVGVPVAVPDWRMLSMQLAGICPAAYTENIDDARIKVVKKWEITEAKLKSMDNPTIGIVPSALFAPTTPVETGPITETSKLRKTVPYSVHSSFSELKAFIEALNPRRIFPIVRNARGMNMDPNHYFPRSTQSGPLADSAVNITPNNTSPNQFNEFHGVNGTNQVNEVNEVNGIDGLNGNNGLNEFNEINGKDNVRKDNGRKDNGREGSGRLLTVKRRSWRKSLKPDNGVRCKIVPRVDFSTDLDDQEVSGSENRPVLEVDSAVNKQGQEMVAGDSRLGVRQQAECTLEPVNFSFVFCGGSESTSRTINCKIVPQVQFGVELGCELGQSDQGKKAMSVEQVGVCGNGAKLSGHVSGSKQQRAFVFNAAVENGVDVTGGNSLDGTTLGNVDQAVQFEGEVHWNPPNLLDNQETGSSSGFGDHVEVWVNGTLNQSVKLACMDSKTMVENCVSTEKEGNNENRGLCEGGCDAVPGLDERRNGSVGGGGGSGRVGKADLEVDNVSFTSSDCGNPCGSQQSLEGSIEIVLTDTDEEEQATEATSKPTQQ